MGLWGCFTRFAELGSKTAKNNYRLYAVGDTHGCANTLRKVLDKIYVDIERHPHCRAEIVFMGDYCDRGPDTRGVLDTLCTEKKKDDGIKRTFLKGNHDAEFLSFINAPKIGIAQLHLTQMIANGGLQTLASYGAYVPDHLKFTHENGAVSSQNLHVGRRLTAHMWSKLRAALPHDHRKFLSELETRYTPDQAPQLFFCHAGVNPAVAIEEQQEAVLLGMEYDRELDKQTPFNRIFAKSHGQSGLVHNRVIVCGHHQRSLGSIESQKSEHGLIFTDAGACMGGELAAIFFVNGEKKGVISTRSRYPAYNSYAIPEEPRENSGVPHNIFAPSYLKTWEQSPTLR